MKRYFSEWSSLSRYVKVDLHLTSPFCPAVFGFKICQDIHDNLLKVDGVDDVKDYFDTRDKEVQRTIDI